MRGCATISCSRVSHKRSSTPGTTTAAVCESRGIEPELSARRPQYRPLLSRTVSGSAAGQAHRCGAKGLRPDVAQRESALHWLLRAHHDGSFVPLEILVRAQGTIGASHGSNVLGNYVRFLRRTQFEAWLSLQQSSRDGLVSDISEVSRANIVTTLGAPGELGASLKQEWAQCTASVAHTKLSMPDVSVTNKSDKLKQLPKIVTLDNAVKARSPARAFQKQTPPEPVDLGRSCPVRQTLLSEEEWDEYRVESEVQDKERLRIANTAELRVPRTSVSTRKSSMPDLGALPHPPSLVLTASPANTSPPWT